MLTSGCAVLGAEDRCSSSSPEVVMYLAWCGWIDLVVDGLSERPMLEGRSQGVQAQPLLVACMTFPCLVAE